MSGIFGFSPTCQVCGVPVHDVALHTRFHKGLGDIARKVYAPEASDEEWAQAVELAGIDLALNEIAEEKEAP